VRKNKEKGGTEIEEKRKQRWECNNEEQTEQHFRTRKSHRRRQGERKALKNGFRRLKSMKKENKNREDPLEIKRTRRKQLLNCSIMTVNCHVNQA
jgi:hypothetical protein